MVRRYGAGPWRAAVIHGGPGAKGSLAPVAHTLSETMGVIEPIQGKYTINQLVEELYAQISFHSDGAMALIGHSWGAWLSILYAVRYPRTVSRLVLVGSGPLEARYTAEIQRRRMFRLTPEEQARFNAVVTQLEQPDTGSHRTLMAVLGALSDKADNFYVEPQEEVAPPLESDAKMFTEVWEQAAELRSRGELMNQARQLSCPVTVIHGAEDPHPAEGVIEPLRAGGIPFEEYVINQCGHNPFLEKYARREFYHILNSVINPRW